MSYFKDREEGIAHLESDLLHIAKAHAVRLGVPLRLEPNLVVQAYDAAISTALFHKIPLDELSHRKELAHLGFWVAELKPISISPPQRPKYFVQKAALALDEALGGNTAALVSPRPSVKANKKYQRAEEAYVNTATFPICEYIALEFIQSMMECEFLRKQKNNKDSGLKSLYEDRHEYFNSVLLEQGVFMDIVNGLRFHIFTPRSFATLIEALFAFEGGQYRRESDGAEL